MGDPAKYLMTVRVFYSKLGRIKYISHLDTNRCVTRAIKRSCLPVWHTLGFNPHIYLTFALPLSLGFESECESFDFRLTEEVPMQEVVDRLNAVFPEGIQAISAAPAAAKPEEIAFAQYTVIQEYDSTDLHKVKTDFLEWCGQDEILVMKKTKKGQKEIDIKPHFKILSANAEEKSLNMQIQAAAGSTLTVNPMLILDKFAAETGKRADWMQLVRTRILKADLTDFR